MLECELLQANLKWLLQSLWNNQYAMGRHSRTGYFLHSIFRLQQLW